ncbi:hypothetical protein [Nocardia wallacei]|uniref:hypothetical protein n=1 Tax=Nocardia wallacei TaxID=480035 RepID=UPI002455092C|nr:hypothetical protein [Nocardia wallacei]
MPDALTAETADTAAVAKRQDVKTSAVDADLVGQLVEQARANGLQLTGEGGLTAPQPGLADPCRTSAG